MSSPNEKRQPGQASAGKTARTGGFKFDSTGGQGNRFLAAMQVRGSVTSREGSRSLDCYDPRARMYVLRNQDKRVTVETRSEVASGGETRRVSVYVLEGGAQ